ncbi:MAG: DUF4093 domain-containing protein [Clostridia bacterium]|nr:DUF4093 domain-containing protein [Clostridia bacterium]
MIKLKQAVIVEGKYDKIRLSNIIDSVIITTDGFGIFKSEEKKELIKLFSQKSGIIIMTDSDNAGQMIRNFVTKLCKSGEIINIYLPSIKGKEKRKTKESAQGFLGVEGTDDSIIIKALQKAGITGEKTTQSTQKVSKTDFYNLGISGGENSKEKREELCVFLNLPSCLTANALLDAVNTLYTYDEFLGEVEKWRQDKAEN